MKGSLIFILTFGELCGDVEHEYIYRYHCDFIPSRSRAQGVGRFLRNMKVEILPLVVRIVGSSVSRGILRLFTSSILEERSVSWIRTIVHSYVRVEYVVIVSSCPREATHPRRIYHDRCHIDSSAVFDTVDCISP